MEERLYTMNIFHPGGNASKDAKAYKISIPSKWAKEMGFEDGERTAKLSYDGEKITIEKYGNCKNKGAKL